MDRLLVLRLRSKGVAAEAWLNGVALLRTPKAGGDCSLPVHEFVIAGSNRLELVVDTEGAVLDRHLEVHRPHLHRRHPSVNRWSGGRWHPNG